MGRIVSKVLPIFPEKLTKKHLEEIKKIVKKLVLEEKIALTKIALEDLEKKNYDRKTAQRTR
jgi:hypothetical protein